MRSLQSMLLCTCIVALLGVAACENFSMTLGTHPPNVEDDGTQFLPLDDMGNLPLYVGGQGAQMAIIGARFDDPAIQSPVTIYAALRIVDDNAANDEAGVFLAYQELMDAPIVEATDGMRYLFDVFMPVDIEKVPENRIAILEFIVIDATLSQTMAKVRIHIGAPEDLPILNQ